VSLATIAVSTLFVGHSVEPALGLAAVAIAVATVGAIDDLRGLSAGVRMAVHLLAGAVLAWTCVQNNPIFDGGLLNVAAAGIAITFVTAWIINLTNFMDGIDGLAASSGVLIITAVGAFAWLHGDTGLCTACAAVSGAVAGFLPWNLSRTRRIFMGDAGSGFLGFAIATALALAWRSGAIGAATVFILPSVLVTDATVTLGIRALRGERVTAAHRSHAYQHLSQQWGTHRPVTALYAGATLLWSIPMAVASDAWPALSVMMLCLAYAPLVVAAILLHAGRRQA
jgi:Fuc2NAc and GlcNAc transferase